MLLRSSYKSILIRLVISSLLLLLSLVSSISLSILEITIIELISSRF